MPDTTLAVGVSTSPTSPRRSGLWTKFKDKLKEQQNTDTSLLNTARLVFAVCKLAWVPVVGSIFGSLLFLLPDQSQDAIRALLSDTHWKDADFWDVALYFLYVVLFLIALLLWAVSAHVWARMTTMHPRALNKLPRGYDDGIARQCLDTVPGLVGFGVFFMMAVVVACVVLQLPHWVYMLTGLPFVPLMGVLAIRDTVRIKWTYLLAAALVSILVDRL